MEKNKIIVIGGVIIGLLVLLLAVLWLLSLFKHRYYSYDSVVKMMEDATNRYYKNYPEMLPVSEGKSILSYNSLVEVEYIKPLNELLVDGDECSAEVVVYKKSDDYTYIPHLNCSDKYVTKELYQQILDANPTVTSGSGLYQGEGGEYYFRGKVTNNYLVLGTAGTGKNKVDILWRILGIDKDNNIKIKAVTNAAKSTYYDDRYNEEQRRYVGYNTFKDSLLKDFLLNLQNTEILLTNDQKRYLVEQTICDMPRSLTDTSKDGSTECANENPEMLMFSTLTPYEYMRVSLDENCQTLDDKSCANFNFLAITEEAKAGWIITPAADSTYKSYYYNGQYFATSDARNKRYVFPVAKISSLTRYVSGSGTKDDPYRIIKVIKSTSSIKK